MRGARFALLTTALAVLALLAAPADLAGAAQAGALTARPA